MTTLAINHVNLNIELLSKLMNSVAVKYNCRVKYNNDSKSVSFTGDESLKPLIVEETAGFFPRRR